MEIVVISPPPKNAPSAGDEIWSETGAADRIAESKRGKNRTDGAPLVCCLSYCSIVYAKKRNKYIRVALANVEGIALESDSEVAAKEILRVNPAPHAWSASK